MRQNTWSLTHGACVGRKRTPEHSAYSNARQRCTNPNAINYEYYGGRGIEFRFDSFEQFLSVVGSRPSDQYSLERIDNDGHYEPGNVRWATRIEQHRNVRSNVHLTFQGETKTIVEWSQSCGVPKWVIRRRKQVLNWCDTCCLTVPSRRGGLPPQPCSHK
jgi:hypothetical protein